MQFLVVSTTIFAITLSLGLGYPQGHEQDSNLKPSEDDDSDMYMEPLKAETRLEETGDRLASEQTFYPSFPPFQNPPLGHSRPFYYQPEAAYSHRPNSAYPQQQISYDSPRYSGYKDDGFRAAANSESLGLLGSGNFGVIKGGTFYEKEGGGGGGGGRGEARGYDREYSSYFGNGHGGPLSYFGRGVPNPKPYQHEQFENFRDFADINTPSNPAYSQYVVVYVNKNSTKEDETTKSPTVRPKNIIESLALLDLESTAPSDDEEVPVKKLSKSKRKLEKLMPEKKFKSKKGIRGTTKAQKELSEPLLALS